VKVEESYSQKQVCINASKYGYNKDYQPHNEAAEIESGQQSCVQGHRDDPKGWRSS
jgi:hypothetical protein